MIRQPDRVKAERLRPLSESEEVCPARGLASHGAFDGRQVNANFERAQGPRRSIHTCLGNPGRLLVISHDDSPYLLLYYMSRPSLLSSIFCSMNWRHLRSDIVGAGVFSSSAILSSLAANQDQTVRRLLAEENIALDAGHWFLDLLHVIEGFLQLIEIGRIEQGKQNL